MTETLPTPDGLGEAILSLSPEQVEAFAHGLNEALVEEAKAVSRLLDWVGVADVSPHRERVLLLCCEFLSRTGQMELGQAHRVARMVADGS